MLFCLGFDSFGGAQLIAPGEVPKIHGVLDRAWSWLLSLVR